MYTEKELLELASKGDQAAFSTIFMCYKDKLYTFLFRLTNSPEQTEDIIQEAFMKLWQNREQLPQIEHFSAYLFQITRNRAINAFKRLAKESSILAEINLRPVPDASNPSTVLAFKELKQLLHQALQQLPPRQQLIFRLSREQGLKHEEIAAQLNLSTSTVKNHLVQALRKIRQQFQSGRSMPGSCLLPVAFTVLYCLSQSFRDDVKNIF